MRLVTLLPWAATFAAVGYAVVDAKERDDATRAIFAELPEGMREEAHDAIRFATVDRLSDIEEFARLLAEKGYTRQAAIATARVHELKESATP